MRRKKRLLFDVLDDMIEPRDRYDGSPVKARRPAKTSTARKPAARAKAKAKAKGEAAPRARAPGEGIRLSYGMAGAVLVVLLVVVGLAYRFGFDHGEGGVFSRESREIPEADAGPRDVDRAHYAVRAATISYARGGFESAAELAQDYVDFLLDCGYVDAVGVPCPDETRPGWGRIVIWAGQAARPEELARAAEHLRSLSFRGKSPFGHAYAELFSRPQ